LDDEIELRSWEVRRNDVSLSIFDLDWTLLAPSDASATTSAESTAEPQAAVAGPDAPLTPVAGATGGGCGSVCFRERKRGSFVC
jgi:hypothetical protein